MLLYALIRYSAIQMYYKYEIFKITVKHYLPTLYFDKIL